MNTTSRTKLAAVSAFKIHNPSISPFSNNQGTPSSVQALNGIQVLSPSSGHKNMPTVLDALVLKEEIRKGGLYGIGLKVHPKTFSVQRINKLIDKFGLESFKDVVSVGDTLLSVDNRILGPGSGDISVILGDVGSFAKLRLRSKETGSDYEIDVKRHVEIQTWNQVLKWYEVRDEYKGQDLCADAQIVDALAAIRASVIDRAGDFVDLLTPAPRAAAAPVETPSSPVTARGDTAAAAENGHGLTFAVEAGAQSLRPCQVHHVAPGSPAHVLESVRFGDEVRAVDYCDVGPANLLRATSFPDFPGRRIILSIDRDGQLLEVALPMTRPANIRAMEQLLSIADGHGRLVRQGADAEALLASLDELMRHAKGMERARLEAEMRAADMAHEAQARISRQVCGAEQLLRPIRAYCKGLEDLVPRADRDALLADKNRLQQEAEALRRVEQELRDALARAALAQQEAHDGLLLKREADEARIDLAAARDEAVRLQRLLEAMVPKGALAAAQDRLRAAEEEAERLRALLAGMVPTEKLAGAQDELRAARDEADRLRKLVEGMVPRGRLDSALDELRGAGEELTRLRAAMEGMAPLASVRAAEAEIEQLRGAITGMVPASEAERLRGAMADMVPKAELVAAKEETARLVRQAETMVPKGRLAEAQEEARLLQEEIGRLRQLVERMVPRTQLAVAEAEAEQLRLLAEGMVPRAELERLRDRIAAMVPRGDVEARDAEIAGLKGAMAAMAPVAELELLRKRMEGMVPRGELDSANDEAGRLRQAMEAMYSKSQYETLQDGVRAAKGEAERLQKLVESMVSRSELEQLKQRIEVMAPREELAAAREEADRLQRLLDAAVPKARLVALQDEVVAAHDEAERLRRAAEGLVPRARLDAAREEADRSAEEVELLRAQLAASVPRARLDAARDELADSAAEVERLLRLADGMVPRAQLERSEEEVRRLRGEVGLLQQEIADLKDRLDALLAPLPPIFEREGRAFEGAFDLQLYAPSPDAVIYCTLDGGAPGPENAAGGPFDRRRLAVRVPDETTVVRAVCVANGRRSAEANERFVRAERPRERARAPPPREDAGVGIVFEAPARSTAAAAGSGTLIREVVPGGAAALDGTIEAGDVLLAVDDRSVGSLGLDDIVALIRGVEGTGVRLTVLKRGGCGADSSLAVTVTLLRSVPPLRPQSEPLRGVGQGRTPPPQQQASFFPILVQYGGPLSSKTPPPPPAE